MSDLTARQSAVVRQVLLGQTNKQVGQALGITEGTVKAHMHTIFSKFGTRSRIELVLRFMEGEK